MFKRHLLYVEDDMNLARVQLRIFRTHYSEFIVHHADTAAAAIYALCSQPFDVVLSDYNLADGNGGEILAYIQREKPMLAARFVYLSDDPACASHVHWLEKPVAMDDLSRKLHEVLS